MENKKRILISPLNWGLGHATRCIPIINLLIKEGCEVIIAGEGKSLYLLQQEFPNLEIIKIKNFEIKYYNNIPMIISMVFQLPKILLSIYKDHLALKNILKKSKIDAVISDNRFGLWNKQIPCVFITHQLRIKSPIFEGLIQKLNYLFINNFSECWIADSIKENLAGNLSVTKEMPKKYKYIGPLSRFKYTKTEKKYKILSIISGPDPARTKLKDSIIRELSLLKEKSLILLGETTKKEDYTIGNCRIISHAKSEKINQYILESEIILTRSGYSTIMDLTKLGSKAIFIPTTGKTEQEYLSKLYKRRNLCFCISEKKFNLKNSITNSLKYNGFRINKENDMLKDVILPFLR